MLKEAYRKNKHRMVNTREFVILADKTCLEKRYSEVEGELLRVLKKARFLYD